MYIFWGECFLSFYVWAVASNEGLHMELEKFKAILEWTMPCIIPEARSFHVMVRFYRKYVKKFSDICGPNYRMFEGKEILLVKCSSKEFEYLKAMYSKSLFLHYSKLIVMLVLWLLIQF
jgi:hypothetical protein